MKTTRHGLEISITTHPSCLPRNGGPGEGSISLTVQNNSMIPATIRMSSIGVDDQNVAQAAFTRQELKIPRRPSLNTLSGSGSATAEKVGHWKPVGAGTTTVHVDLALSNILSSSHANLGTTMLLADVEVT